MKYLTVAEYAAAHGISEQAVYKQIRAGKLLTVEREENGKRKKFIPEEEPAAGTAATPDAALAAALAALTEQLKAKDAQIAAQQAQIMELAKLVDQAQQLQAHANKLFELAAHPEAAAPAAGDSAADEPPEGGPVSFSQDTGQHPGRAGAVPDLGTAHPEAKRGFWSKLFG